MLSPLPAIRTYAPALAETPSRASAGGTVASLQRYALLGAMPGRALPAGWRIAPKALYSGSRLSMQLKTASYRATSITWPWPLV